MSESPLALDRRSPRLGEHEAEILREIGSLALTRPGLTAADAERQIGPISEEC